MQPLCPHPTSAVTNQWSVDHWWPHEVRKVGDRKLQPQPLGTQLLRLSVSISLGSPAT